MQIYLKYQFGFPANLQTSGTEAHQDFSCSLRPVSPCVDVRRFCNNSHGNPETGKTINTVVNQSMFNEQYDDFFFICFESNIVLLIGFLSEFGIFNRQLIGIKRLEHSRIGP